MEGVEEEASGEDGEDGGATRVEEEGGSRGRARATWALWVKEGSRSSSRGGSR